MADPGHEADGRGSLLVLSAPSGTGKSTLVRRLLDEVGGLAFSVSATTRPPRRGERDGVDYHFLEPDRFVELLSAGRFLEHAEVHGRLYGTLRDEVDRELDRGLDVLLELDVQGARQVRAAAPAACLVFLLPPARHVLEARLRGRALDAPEAIAARLADAAGEVAQAGNFDHLVVNDDLDRAAADLVAIVRGRRTLRLKLEAKLAAVRRDFGVEARAWPPAGGPTTGAAS